MNVCEDISTCSLCAERFSQTATQHNPRPIIWFRPSARILIAGQAPGARVHKSGQPFTDPSGDRLRQWLGLNVDQFYDRKCIAIVPMAFCFPGYNAKGADLPPPSVCAKTWHQRVFAMLPNIRLRILVGGYAHRWHLRTTATVTDVVTRWRHYAPHTFPLPHPSWRNTTWIRKNPWFESELLPALGSRVQEEWNDDN